MSEPGLPQRWTPEWFRAGVRRRVRAFPREARAFHIRLDAWIRFRARRRRYRILSRSEICARRRSDTVFIFGCGYSINDVTPEEARFFEQHDTLGFNYFFRQDLLRVDFHLAREMATNDRDRTVWESELRAYVGAIEASPYYRDTVMLLQTGWRAINPNQTVGYGILPPGREVFLFRSDAKRRELARSFDEALPHRFGTLEECVNMAYLMGWKTIVLVGVDLYDRRYFWLGPDETATSDLRRDATWCDTHHTALGGGIVQRIGEWAKALEQEGVHLQVYNPRSLLAEVIPVYPGVRDPAAVAALAR